jgi:hypothetical protein
MQKQINTTLFVLAIMMLFGFQQSQAQDKDDVKMAKQILKVRKWNSSKLQKDGREINLKSTVGVVVMEFYVFKEKKTVTSTDADGNEVKKKVQESSNVFKLEMGGNDRSFNYTVKSDSVQFDRVKGWNDYRIVRCEKDELVLEQDLDGSLFRWTMIPAPKEKKEKVVKKK